jgi:putative tryptophan/tyrosine transport system substrate-binding protein
MDRRTFIVALFALYGCGQKEEPEKSAEASKSAPEAAEASKSAPEAAGAQQTGKGYRIGFLGPANASSWARYIAALRQGLRELGYEEGRNLVIEYRWAEEDLDRLPELASELVSLKVDLIVTDGTPGSRAAKQATKTISIVMAAVGDPARSGLVASLARPGGNLTGNSIVEGDLIMKRLQLVREVIPNASRLGLLYVPGTQIGAAAEAGARVVDDTAGSLGMQVHRFGIRELNDLASALATMVKERTDALIVRNDALLVVHYGEIARLAVQHRLPTVGSAEQFVEAGGLFAYGVNVVETYRHAAVYVDKILRGAKPADLPIEQPTKYVLVVNLKTAKALGITIPPSLLLRADEVIQ